MKTVVFFALLVATIVASNVMVEAFKMNKFRQLLLTKLQEVGTYAQNYLDSHNLEYETTPDYP